MRKLIRTMIVVAALGAAAQAEAFIYTLGNLNATIPDNNLSGYESSQTVSGLSGPILDVTVNLAISGGFNGDLYAYVTHNNATAVLLDRVGRSSTNNVGYPDAGFGPNASQTAFTFDDEASQDVHFYRTVSYALNGNGQLTGTWQPDARGLDPLSAGSAFDTAARTNTLSVFNGMDPNGTWLFFIADCSPGGVSTLNSWSVNIAAVPEPSTAGLLALGAALVVRRRSFRV